MGEGQYKRIADEYVREYGAQLRRELEAIEQRQITPGVSSLDHRVRRGTGAVKRMRYTRYTGLIAACLVVAILTPFLLRFYISQPGDTGSNLYPSAPTTSPTETGKAPPDDAQQSEAQPYEILPLSFNMPSQFQMESVEQDVEKTIYRLNDERLDDVVITLERSGDISRYDTLTEVPIGGNNAYGSSGDGYNLLAFIDEDSDILYVLTCKYDINTLVLLGNSILV